MLPVIACYVILCSNSSGIQLRHFTRQSGHHDQTVVSSEPCEYETIDDVRDTILKNSEALKDEYMFSPCEAYDLHERPANMNAEGGYEVIQEQKPAIRNIDQSYEVINEREKHRK